MTRARFGRLFEAVAAVGAASAVAVMASGSSLDRSQRALTPATHVIEIRQFRFVPEMVLVSLGDTIRWINRDPVPHTATAADSSWDTGRLEPDESGILVVQSGSHREYVCAYHPTMTGMVRVDSSGAPRPWR